MTKITLTNLVNLQNETTAVNAINTNNATLTTALDNTLSRDGTSPNTMGANLDMNSNRILNVPAPITGTDVARLSDVVAPGGSVTISPLPVAGTVGQSLTKNSSTNYDASWISVVPTAGTVNQSLVKNSGTNFDASWKDIGYASFNVKNFGAKGDGATDDSTAITNCITAAVAAGGTVVLPDGNYKHASTLNWAWIGLKVIALGGNVKFTHTGTGVAHQFSGMVNYPGTQGCIEGLFGAEVPITIVGNVNTTNCILIDNWHFGKMNVQLGGACNNAFVLGQDTGLPQVGSCSVDTTYQFNISYNVAGAYTTVPWYGVRMTKPAGCYFPRLIIEGVGNVANATSGLSLIQAVNCVFVGGTVESCLCGGVSLGSTCSRNTFINIDSESNGAGNDWAIQGTNNVLINCAGGGTTPGQFIAGNNNRYLGCRFQSVVVQAGASDNVFDNCTYITAFTDGGTRTTIINPDILATPVLYSNGGATFLASTAIPAGGTTGAGVKLSSTSNLGLFFGSGAPTLSAAQGSIYIRTDGSGTATRLYINNNGSTAWSAVSTTT